MSVTETSLLAFSFDVEVTCSEGGTVAAYPNPAGSAGAEYIIEGTCDGASALPHPLIACISRMASHRTAFPCRSPCCAGQWTDARWLVAV